MKINLPEAARKRREQEDAKLHKERALEDCYHAEFLDHSILNARDMNTLVGGIRALTDIVRELCEEKKAA